MKRKILLIVYFICFRFYSQGQVTDDFSDGNLINPTWYGDDSLFMVNAAMQLQTKGTVAKEIFLATSSNVYRNCEWRLWLRNAFSPSTQNFSRFYLTSDSLNLKGSLHGYYVQIGGSSGNTDSICLYRQNGNLRIPVISGRPSTVSKSNNVVSLKVVHDSLGQWFLFSDTGGIADFILEGTAFDSEINTSAFTGYFCKYTSGNSRNFYLDNLYAGPIVIDTIGPTIDSLYVIDSNSLRLVFSEPLDLNSAQAPLNYLLSNISANPLIANSQPGKSSEVTLKFSAAFTNGLEYNLRISGIYDSYQNKMKDQVWSFLYFIAGPHDLLISEFMADPSPDVGLPEAEFVEVYNHANHIISLASWTLGDGTSNTVLPNISIDPDSFAIICSTKDSALFAPFGKLILAGSLPALNNSEDKIQIMNPLGSVIHQLEFTLEWYEDLMKSAGGWSIELINPNDLCKGKDDYSVSANPSGGTPGKRNSRWATNYDTILPFISRIQVLSSSTVLVEFSERMDSFSLSGSSVLINQGAGALSKQSNKGGDSLFINVTPLVPEHLYTLIFKDARDCNGNLMISDTFTLRWLPPEKAISYDIVIHEIMPDPEPAVELPVSEYIELYNRSLKHISLKNWSMGDPGKSTLLPDVLLIRDSMLVICPKGNESMFAGICPVIGVPGFPSLNNSGDTLILKDSSGNIIHFLHYSASFYKDKVKEGGGWSLEMVDANNPCGGEANWKVCKDNRGGTPGAPNSVNGYNRDLTPPGLLEAYPLNDHMVRISFDEPMNRSGLGLPSHYILHSASSLLNVEILSPDSRKLLLTYSSPFDSVTIYHLHIDSVTDCVGNPIRQDNYADFGLPSLLNISDLTINEILFNPKAGGDDFVELVNRGERIVDLKELFLANADSRNIINEYYAVCPDGFLLFPGQYVVLTADVKGLLSQYYIPDPTRIVQCETPSFNDDDGVCILLELPDKRLDQLNYDEKMHFTLLDNKEGVSLERIDFNRPVTDRTNWTSASSTCGYATPGYKNSQYQNTRNEDESLKISPEVFSPDNDGYNDVVDFSYNTGEAGCIGNLFIFNIRGLPVKRLLNNAILGTSGVCSWDGICDNGNVAEMGIYTIYFEWFNLDGSVKNTKKALVVAHKL